MQFNDGNKFVFFLIEVILDYNIRILGGAVAHRPPPSSPPQVKVALTVSVIDMIFHVILIIQKKLLSLNVRIISIDVSI